MSARSEALLRLLWPPGQEGGGMFALVDTAADENIYPRLFESDLVYRSLYPGELGESLADVAPYLVALTPGAPFTSWLIDVGWGRAWASYVESALDFEFLLLHFQRYVLAFDELGSPQYFRFYDPRVLQAHLTATSPAERETFVAPLLRCVVESDAGAGAVTFARAPATGLDTVTLRLPPA